MCCFSKPVHSVTETRIFAAGAPDARQYLAYSMTFSADEDLAMILPLPVAPGSGENAVTFIDMSGYAEFFTDLLEGFLPPDMLDLDGGTRFAVAACAPLAVIEVGSFEASYVPTIRDFDRLDARFRLPVDAWSQLPGYEHFGFAVFKLKTGKHRVHPMAFSFPSAVAGSLFFPTVHIHDGVAHAEANFEHLLFCQRDASAAGKLAAGWEVSKAAASFVDVARTYGMIDGTRPVHCLAMMGRKANRDTYLEN